jgi:hypothetical protein
LHPNRRQRTVLQNRQVREKVKVLKYHPHFLAHAFDIANIFIQLDAINHNTSLLMLFQVVNAANGCGFT